MSFWLLIKHNPHASNDLRENLSMAVFGSVNEAYSAFQTEVNNLVQSGDISPDDVQDLLSNMAQNGHVWYADLQYEIRKL